MKKLIPLVFTALLTCQGWAQDEKAALLDGLRHDGFLKARSAVLAERLVDFKLTPTWWAYFTPDGNTSQRNDMGNMINVLETAASNMGLGVVDTLDSARDCQSPIFLETVDSWKPKLHLTLIMDDVPANAVDKAMGNFNKAIYPLTWGKPKSGKYFVTVHVNPKAKALVCAWDKARTQLNVTVPVYADFSQGDIQSVVQRAE